MTEELLAAGIGAGQTSVGVIAYIIIGGLAGWIASKFMGTDAQQGIILNVVVGVVGAIIGGLILQIFGVDVDGGGWWFTFFIALFGAVILLWLVKLVTGRR
ncbi:GlsB/YeaQ/YmgE family stress response membrane protein [Rhodococcus sp. X156]|uniref:GlsB/YeaQ/YmgE family stress response membrane protein n=1 Tax=Rhodococcus sp. X156 TaxID=2499145 RepID=UPI000FD9D581|nr:GlsB/YeaQ/YmgE family stress response membrane protein [Rhodococcus sp. X156]